MESPRTHKARSVVEAARLHKAKHRRNRGLTLVEGPEVLSDATEAGVVVREVFSVDGFPGSVPVTEEALKRLAGTKSPRGPIGVVEIPTEWLDRTRNLLVSVGVSDPGNVGTLIRTAASYGWGFAYTPDSADPWAPKTVRAGAGGQFQTSLARVGSLSEIAEWPMAASVVRGGAPIEAISARPIALLIGSEAHGLSEEAIEAADYSVTIDLVGETESLNAAVAAGILIHEFSKGPGLTPPGV